MVGKFCVVRSYSAGVFFGMVELVEQSGTGRQRVTLTNSRRLWKWVAKEGVALSGVAVFGLDIKTSTVDSVVQGHHQVDDVVEIIEASAVAVEVICGR